MLDSVMTPLPVCFQIDPQQTEVNTVNDMYSLIEKFTVPTPPEDFAVFQVCVCSIRFIIVMFSCSI